MLDHCFGLILICFEVLLNPESHLVETEYSISIEIQSFEGGPEFILVVVIVDEVDDEDKHSVLDSGLLHFFEFVHVDQGVDDESALDLLFLTLLQVGLEPAVFHDLHHRQSFADVSLQHLLEQEDSSFGDILPE